MDDSELRPTQNLDGFELSQDLQDKQLEMLERKYGGHLRTRCAAITIQQAYRRYSMTKKFERLRSAMSMEKRNSRRLSDYRSNSVWLQGHDDNQKTITRAFTIDCHCDHYSTSGSFINHKTMRLQRSPHVDMDDDTDRTLTGKVVSLRQSLETKCDRVRDEKKFSDSFTDGNEGICNMVDNTLDFHSINFEKLLDSKETDLDESLQSDISIANVRTVETPLEASRCLTQSKLPVAVISPQRKRGPPPSPPLRTTSRLSSYQSLSSSPGENSSERQNHQPEHEVHIHLESDEVDSRRIYNNQHVKMRTRKYSQQLFKALNHTDSLNHSNSTESSDILQQSAIIPRTVLSPEASPIWKRKSVTNSGSSSSIKSAEIKRMSNISEGSEPDSSDNRYSTSSSDSAIVSSYCGNSHHLFNDSDYVGYEHNTGYSGFISLDLSGYQHAPRKNRRETSHSPPRIGQKQRKREYRVGLNLFNKKPEKGLRYLIQKCFIKDSAPDVAKFLIGRKGLSKQMIGEYLGNLQNTFNQEVLEYFVDEIDLRHLEVDVALRKFQTFFRMPGEAQKIERLMETFAHRYCECNLSVVGRFRSCDTVFLLAFAIIMLNTDSHNHNIKHERRMKLDDFIKNLRNIDDGGDLERDFLVGIYERVRSEEFMSGVDHTSQVQRVEASVIGKKPQLCLPHRRLVCYCRLFEVNDPSKKEKIGLHQREVFLFNDMLLITKISSKKKGSVTYSFKQSFLLCGMQVFLYETSHYQFGIRLTIHLDGKILITFNARNEHDRSKFVEDLKDCILEVNEMESIRIENELHKQKAAASHKRHEMNRISSDSGMVDVDLHRPSNGAHRLSAPGCSIKRTPLMSSLVDLTECSNLRPQQRRGSGGSLDSGMYMLQTSTTSVSTATSQDESTSASTPSSSHSEPIVQGSSLLLRNNGVINV